MSELKVTARSGKGIHLKVGNIVEVSMMALPEGVEGAKQLAAYPACLTAFDTAKNVAQIYLAHDVEMNTYIVPITCVARACMPLPSDVYPRKSSVEVQTRVSDTDEYGWWTASVLAYDADAKDYLVEWPYGAGKARVPAVHVREASFKYYTE
jgi:hypothetical protein